MRVVALLAFRNEARVLGRTLAHLREQGVETCLIDNGSTDASRAIAEGFRGPGGGVFRLEELPFAGSFNMPELMWCKERLAAEIAADWFLHQDADEIRQAPAPFVTLAEGFAAAEAAGCNAVEFEEFVFLPAADGPEAEENFEGTDFVATMRRYYPFRPQAQHRVNAWKNQPGVPVDLLTHYGHRVEFPGRRVYGTPFVLRHYMALSRAHALGKYAGRVHSAGDIRWRGWTDARVGFRPENLHLPTRAEMRRLGPEEAWNRSDPWPAHVFIGQRPLSPRPADPATKPTSAPATVPQTPRASPPPGKKLPAPLPVIVGVARSGTTLLRLMLDAHPQLAIGPETHFLPELAALARGPEAEDPAAFLRVVTGSLNWREFGLTEDRLRAELAGLEPFRVGTATRRFFRLYARGRGKPRWGDKTPPYVTRLREIQELLPEARFIHLIRDGRDVSLSLRHLWFGPGQELQDQAANWVWRIREARQQAAFCPHYLEVRYERLLADPAGELARVCDFLELPFDPGMTAYHETADARLRAEIRDRHDAEGKVTVSADQRHAIFAHVRRPPDPARAGRWRTEMSADERARFEAVAGDLLRELGYETPAARDNAGLTGSVPPSP